MKLSPKRFDSWNSTPNTSLWLRLSTRASLSAAVCELPLDTNVWFLSGLTVVNQLDGGLQGYSTGVRKTTDAQQATEVTNNGSMIGSPSNR
jgi:hypothetical protein